MRKETGNYFSLKKKKKITLFLHFAIHYFENVEQQGNENDLKMLAQIIILFRIRYRQQHNRLTRIQLQHSLHIFCINHRGS